jgi:hypothetical protein
VQVSQIEEVRFGAAVLKKGKPIWGVLLIPFDGSEGIVINAQVFGRAEIERFKRSLNDHINRLNNRNV